MFSLSQLAQPSVQDRIKKNATRFGNKSSNLMELNELCSTFTDDVIKIKVPEIAPIDDAMIKAHLDTHVKEWRTLWNNFVDYHRGQALSESEKLALKKLQTLIKECFNKHPFPISSLKNLEKDALLMVRSTGEEDTVEIANPGGNKSVAAIKNEEKSISNAIGVVVASYFSKKSIAQRLVSGDTIKKDSFMPVLIQKMIGEQLEGEEKESHIVASGVMYAGGPMTRMDVAPGHGEAIVNSKTPFDTYEVTEEGVVHAEIHAKPLRLIPTEEKVGSGLPPKRKLILKSNTENLQKNPTLDPDIAKRIANIGRKIAAHYSMPMDIEFVYEPLTKTLNIVQARPIPAHSKKVKPSAILPEHWNKIKNDNNIEKINAAVISPAGSVTKVITESKQVVIADNIENALKQCLEESRTEENTRAVFVAKPSASTSHEAAQFNAMGIPVFKTDINVISHIVNQKNPILIADTQHQSIVNWANQCKLAESRETELSNAKIIGEGLFVSSKSARKTLLPISMSDNKELNATIKKYLENKDVTFNPKKAYSELNTSIENLEAASFQNKNEAQFEALQKITTIFKKISGSTNASKKNSPHKKLFLHAMHSIAEIDHCLTKLSTSDKETEKESTQHLLLDLVNKLKALVVDAGEEGLYSDSIKQIAALNKNNEIKLPQKFIAPQRKEFLVEFVKLNQLILHPTTRAKWTDFATYCSKHPITRKLLAKYIKLCFQFNLQSELVNNCFPKIYVSNLTDKTNATRLFNEIEKNLGEFKSSRLIENHQTISSFEKRIPEWNEPKKFDKLFKEFEENLIPIIKSLDLKKSMSNLSKQALLKQVQYLADVIDKSIKSLKGSQEYATQSTLLVKRFVKLLQPYHDLMRVCMEAIPTEQYDKWRKSIQHDEEYNPKHKMIEVITESFQATSKKEDSKQLNPSGEVSIASATVGVAASFYRQFVRKKNSVTLEEFFSLFHQNILASTVILAKDGEIDLQQLPEPLTLLMKKIESNTDSESNIQRLSIQHQHPMLFVEYNIALRNHSAKLNIEYDTRDGSFSLNHRYFGHNEYKRMSILAGLAEIEGVFLKAEQEKRAHYDEGKYFLEFGWKFKKEQLNSIVTNINSVINNYSNMTNHYTCINHGDLIRSVKTRHDKHTGPFTKLFEEYQNKISKSNIDLDKLHDHLNEQILELSKNNNLSGIKEIAAAISKKDLNKLLSHKDQHGNNALIWACNRGYNEIAAWLLLQDTENLQKEVLSNELGNYLDNVNINLYESIKNLNFKQIKYIFQEYKNIPLEKIVNTKNITIAQLFEDKDTVNNQNTSIGQLCEKFIEAVENQNLTSLKLFKDSVPENIFKKLLAAENKSGNNALMIAIDKTNVELMQWLLETTSHQTNWKSEDCLNLKKIRQLILNQKYKALKKFKQKNDPTNKFNKFLTKMMGEQFLEFAKSGNLASLKKILNAKFLDNVLAFQDELGNTALHLAATNQKFDCVNYLIYRDTKGILVTLKNTKNQNFFEAMVSHASHNIIRGNFTILETYLAEYPEMANSPEVQYFLSSKLLGYASNGDLEKIKYLSKILPDFVFKKILIKPDPNGSTAILRAAFPGHTEIVNFILNEDKEDIQKNILNKDGFNYLKALAIHLNALSQQKDYKKMKFVMDEVKGSGMMQCTEIILTEQFRELVVKGDVDKIKELKDLCSDTLFSTIFNQQDISKNNALILATLENHEKLVEFLLSLDVQNKWRNQKNLRGYCYNDYAFQLHLIQLAKSHDFEKINILLKEHEDKNHKKFEFIEDRNFPSFHQIIFNNMKELIKKDDFIKLQQINKFYPMDEKIIPSLSERLIAIAKYESHVELFKEYAKIVPIDLFKKALLLKDSISDIPITWAASKGYVGIVKFLLEHDQDNAQKNTRNRNGRNYLDELLYFLKDLAENNKYTVIKQITDAINDPALLLSLKYEFKGRCFEHIKDNSLDKLKEMQTLFPDIFLSNMKSLDDEGLNPLNLAAEYGDEKTHNFILSLDGNKFLQESKHHLNYSCHDFDIDKTLSTLIRDKNYAEIKATLALEPKPMKFIEKRQKGEPFKQLMQQHIIELVKSDKLDALKIILQIPEFHDFAIEKMGRRLIILSQYDKLPMIQKWETELPADIFQKLILQKNDNHDTAVMWAAYEGSISIMNLLLKYDNNGNQLTIKNKNGNNYIDELHGRIVKLAHAKNYAKIRSILTNVKDLTLSPKVEEILKEQLITRFSNGDFDDFYVIKALFLKNFQAALMSEDKSGNNPLLLAAYHDKKDIVNHILMFSNQDEKLQNKTNQAGLCYKDYAINDELIDLIEVKDFEKIKKMLEKPNIKFIEYRRGNPIFKERAFQEIDTLIKNGAFLHLKNMAKIPMFQETINNKLCDLFIELAKDNKLDLLKSLSQNISRETLDKLLKHQDKNGDSAILWSTYSGHDDVTKWLLSVDTKNIQAKIKSKDKYDYLDNISYFLITQLRKGEYKCVGQYLNEYKGIRTDKGFKEPTNTLEAKIAEVFILKIKKNTEELKDYISSIPEHLIRKTFTNKNNPVKKAPYEFAEQKCITFAKANNLKNLKEFGEVFPKEMLKSILQFKDATGKTALDYFTNSGNTDGIAWTSEKSAETPPKYSGIMSFFTSTSSTPTSADTDSTLKAKTSL